MTVPLHPLAPSVQPAPPVGARDVAALWPLCLDIAERRRAGLPPPALSPGLSWQPGRGHALRGEWDAEALALFDLFKPLLDRHGAEGEWCIGQLGQSLDGCIATHTGDSNFVNGPEGLVHVHRLRALCDAVIVGAGTAALDNPQLTTRRVPGPNAARVVLDPSLRVPAGARVFTDGHAPTWLVCTETRAAEAAARVGAARVIALPRGSSDLDGANPLPLPAVMDALRARGLQMLFVEGGGLTVSQFVRQGCLDRLHLLVAPVVIGAGQPGLQVQPARRMDDALRPPARTFALGSDMLWDLDLQG